jgi:hypothetical protein
MEVLDVVIKAIVAARDQGTKGLYGKGKPADFRHQ